MEDKDILLAREALLRLIDREVEDEKERRLKLYIRRPSSVGMNPDVDNYRLEKILSSLNRKRGLFK
jgi:hypothetical protein